MSHPEQRFRSVAPWVAFLMGMVFFSILPRLLFSPLLVNIAADLDISVAQASRFFFFLSSGFVVSLLFSGFVATHLTHRWTIVLAASFTGVSLVAISHTNDPFMFHVLLVLVGAGGGLYPGSGLATVSAMVHDRHRGKALAVHESGPNLAFVMAPVIAALLLPVMSWRAILQLTGFGALGAAAAFAAFGRGGTFAGQPPHFEKLKVFLTNRSFWVLATLFMLAGCAAMGVFSVLPTYLVVDRGLPQETVNALVGISRITGFGAIFLTGILTDRLGIRVVIGTIFAITGSVTLMLGLLSGAPLLIAVFLQPLVVNAFFPAALTAISTIGPPEARNLGVSLAIPLANFVGAGIAPAVLGALGESGNFPLGFVALGVMILASLGLLPLLERHK